MSLVYVVLGEFAYDVGASDWGGVQGSSATDKPLLLGNIRASEIHPQLRKHNGVIAHM